jgi:hypothetical protein
MAKFVPINKTRHAAKAWVRPTNYTFAAREATVPIVGLEVAMAAPNMPLAFVKAEKLTQLAAITAPQTGNNLFVGKDGRWLGSYVPAVLRCYPFRLARIEGKEEMALCVAEESLADKGEPLYDGEGNLTPKVKNSAAVLESYEKSRQQTLFAAATLEEAGVLTPWSIKFKAPNGAEVRLDGVWRADEAALNALDEATFLKLRKVGALPIAYAQIISMSRLAMLSRLADLREKLAATSAGKKPEINLDFLREEDGNLIF